MKADKSIINHVLRVLRETGPMDCSDLAESIASSVDVAVELLVRGGHVETGTDGRVACRGTRWGPAPEGGAPPRWLGAPACVHGEVLRRARVAPIRIGATLEGTIRRTGATPVSWEVARDMVARGVLVEVASPYLSAAPPPCTYYAARPGRYPLEYLDLRIAAAVIAYGEVTAGQLIGSRITYRVINAAMQRLADDALLVPTGSTVGHVGRRRPRWYAPTPRLLAEMMDD